MNIKNANCKSIVNNMQTLILDEFLIFLLFILKAYFIRALTNNKNIFFCILLICIWGSCIMHFELQDCKQESLQKMLIIHILQNL